jgi:hypothetical protein
LLRKPLLAIVVLLFLWGPMNMLLDTFKLEAFSPITLNRRIPTLLRQSWREADTGSPAASQEEMEALRRMGEVFVTALSGGSPARPPEPSPFYDRDKSLDFSLARVVLGYGVPTLLAIGLATLCFCLRDL